MLNKIYKFICLLIILIITFAFISACGESYQQSNSVNRNNPNKYEIIKNDDIKLNYNNIEIDINK